MAEPPRWKAMYQFVVARAFDGCVRVQASLAGARTDLESTPLVLDTRDAEGRHTLLDSAVTHIEHASGCLSGFIVSMAAAKLLALHGCGAVPSEPLASIGDLLRHHDRHDEWLTLRRLEGTRESGTTPRTRSAERRRPSLALLASVRFMLHSRIPDTAGRRQAMEEQLRAAAAELQAVVGSVVNMSATEPAVGNRIQ